MRYSVYDSIYGNFITGLWPKHQCEIILNRLISNHLECCDRFEIRGRDEEIDCYERKSALLIIDKDTKDIRCVFHWESRQYGLAFSDNNKYIFVRYDLEKNIDVDNMFNRIYSSKWDGRGTIIDLKCTD